MNEWAVWDGQLYVLKRVAQAKRAILLELEKAKFVVSDIAVVEAREHKDVRTYVFAYLQG